MILNHLTSLTFREHTFHAAWDESGAGRDNPFVNRRNSANSGRFFCARCIPLWRLVRGTRVARGRFLFTGIVTPVSVATITAVTSGLVAPRN